MPCSSFEPLLAPYVDGALLPAPVRMQLGAHLERCTSCSALLEELRVIDALLLTARPVDPAPNFTFRVMAELNSFPAPRVRRAPIWESSRPISSSPGSSLAASSISAAPTRRRRIRGERLEEAFLSLLLDADHHVAVDGPPTVACTSASMAASSVRSIHWTTVPSRLPSLSDTGLTMRRMLASPILRSKVVAVLRLTRKFGWSDGAQLKESKSCPESAPH